MTTDKAPELLPCPFCGKNAKLTHRKNWGHIVTCQGCCAEAGGSYRPEIAMAISDWNTRSALAPAAPSPDVLALVELLNTPDQSDGKLGRYHYNWDRVDAALARITDTGGKDE